MKICMIVPKGLPLPAVKGGAIETLVTNLIKENEKHKQIDLSVVSMYDKQAEQEAKNYKWTKFIYVKKNFTYYLQAIIIHLKNLFNQNLNTYNEIVLNKIKKTKFDYIIVEDGAYNNFQNYLHYFKKSQLVLHFHHVGPSSQMIDNTFDKFIGVSEYVNQIFSKNSNIKNKYVLKNCINVDNFKGQLTIDEKNKLRQKLGFTKKDFIALYCGRLVEVKGIKELINAINTSHENIKLLVVGSQNFGDVQDIIGIGDNDINKQKIKFTGFVNNEEVYKYYQIANVLALPTKIPDAAPLVCIEGMVSGLPIITTGTGGIKEYVDKYGIYVDNDDKLSESLKNQIMDVYKNYDKLKKTMLEASKKALNFNTNNYYSDFLTILNEFKNQIEN